MVLQGKELSRALPAKSSAAQEGNNESYAHGFTCSRHSEKKAKEIGGIIFSNMFYLTLYIEHNSFL